MALNPRASSGHKIQIPPYKQAVGYYDKIKRERADFK